MIPNHTQFIAAIQEQRKVTVRFYSKPDSGVLDHVCAPMAYGPGGSVPDGLNRYWFLDYTSSTGSHTLGLVPQQIVDLQVLGEGFDPTKFIVELSPTFVPPPAKLAPGAVASAGGHTIPIL